MSSQPPFTPPGGVPPGTPPYDPRTQWRVYREQQRAAWRAQRDAWRAQRHAWKAGYGGYVPHSPSIVGPLILVAVGIIGLLMYSGHISASTFWSWYGHWWPLLLIAAGLALLGEWALDIRRKTPVHRGGGFVGILILLAILGLGASGWNNFWGPMRAEWGDNKDNNFFNFFGLPEHDEDQQILNTQVPADAVVQIENPRGDVSITAGDGNNVQVQAHQIAFANSDDGAKKIFDAEQAHVTISGNTVLVKSDSNDSGRLNLAVTVPKNAKVTVHSGHGDVTAAGLGAGITITSSHGDVHLSTIQGSTQVHFSNDRGDLSAHGVNGDLSADGNCNDVTFSEIKGQVNLNGEIFGDVHMESLAGPLHLHTSVTELQLAALPGDMTLDSDDLRVTEAKGAVRVTTHAKDVDLSQIYGDTYVDNSRGQISIEPAGSYNIEAKSGKGDVEVTLAPDASATVDGRTHNGDIVSDYALVINGDESKTVSGRIGSGQGKITLNADVGDIRIKKGSGFPPTPPSPPTAAATPNAPHLKAPKTPPAQPVTQ
ncbi:MAG TPA: DUF4097 family beta strand repeat-containing protein [Terracidiphilus sp.]|jgi:DUF4097 and DUF4098 domain-containing protein YvlB|nr:DUF4097 family beta strand repeat-containing protein [Terracidiphilus sp.]